MADNIGPYSTGASTQKPPLFDAGNYGFWKFRMENFLKGVNHMLYNATVKETYQVPEIDPDDMNPEELKKYRVNHQAMTAILCSLTSNEYSQVMGLTTANEVWRKLEVLHKVTAQVQKAKIQMLVQ